MNIDAALALLALDRSATREEVEQQYRVRARFMHPDRFADRPDAEKQLASEEFKRLTLARDTLRDTWGSWALASAGGTQKQAAPPSRATSAASTRRGTASQHSSSRPANDRTTRGAKMPGTNAPPLDPRRGADLEQTIFLDTKIFDRGASIEVETKLGTVRVHIPPGMPLGGKLRVRERGYPGVHGGRAGDLIVWAEVKAPVRKPTRSFHHASARSGVPRGASRPLKQRGRTVSPSVWLWSVVATVVFVAAVAVGVDLLR